MPKYWGKQIFAYGRFPEVGQKQKTEREKKERGLNDGNNNGTQARMAHASRLGQQIVFNCICSTCICISIFYDS